MWMIYFDLDRCCEVWEMACKLLVWLRARILMVHDLRTDCSSFRGVPGLINVGCLKDGAWCV